VGTETNSDLTTYVEQEPTVDGNENKVSGSGQIDYDNSRDQTHTVRTAGYITDCTVSVSINSTTAGPVDADSIREHVARAAGISAVESETMTAEEYLSSKISVLASPFYVEPEAEVVPTVSLLSSLNLPFPDWVVYVAAGGLLLLIIILVLVIVLIKKKKKKKKLAQAAAEQQALEELLAATAAAEPTASPQGADVMSLQTERSMELRKSIRRFADENPELAAQMIKVWLRGGEESG
jgi:flagellar M-ring protein FliF